ncbi:MAG: NUDIX domain-containing protein [Anaerolineae bacterium]|nr:NUDIX domain-containing protein [Anaerolineae bacterium]
MTLPGAATVVRDVNGRVLAIRRGDLGTWDMPGGWCELGETATGTAVREVHEETGLHVRPTRLIGVYSNPAWIVRYPNGDEVRPVGALFECGVIGGRLRADGVEALDVAFIDPDAPDTLGTSPLDASPLHAAFWEDARHPRPEPYLR